MKTLLLILLTSSSFGMAQSNTIPQNLNSKEKVGAIAFDASIDRADFTVCDEFNIEEYYQVNPKYGEGMRTIQNYFSPHLTELNGFIEQDGYVTIRFVINCQGETDRYRSVFVNPSFQNSEGNNTLQTKLTELVRLMGKWTPGNYEGKNYDAYQHIKFRIKNKKIVDILF